MRYGTLASAMRHPLVEGGERLLVERHRALGGELADEHTQPAPATREVEQAVELEPKQLAETPARASKDADGAAPATSSNCPTAAMRAKSSVGVSARGTCCRSFGRSVTWTSERAGRAGHCQKTRSSRKLRSVDTAWCCRETLPGSPRPRRPREERPWFHTKHSSTTPLSPKPRGLLGHLATGRRRASGGHLVKQPRSLPESLEEAGVSAFLADLNTHRDRAMTLAMVLGGLRLAKVRALLLADVDIGARRVRVVGKGNRERVVPTGAWRELPTSEPPQAPDVRELFVR